MELFEGWRMAEYTSALIVDDDELWLKAAARQLGRRGKIEVAPTADLAREIANRVAVDLAIVDLRLSGGSSGIDVIRELRAKHPATRIALLSAHLSFVDVVAAVKAGADAAVPKPATIQEVLRALGNEPSSRSRTRPMSLARREWECIHRVLAFHDGNLTLAAEELGIHRVTLQRKRKRRAPKW